MRRFTGSVVRTAMMSVGVVPTTTVLSLAVRMDHLPFFGPEEDPDPPLEVLKQRSFKKLLLAERRISLSRDYGGLYCCQMINDGRDIVNAIEEELKQRGVDDEQLNQKILQVRELAVERTVEMELE